VQPEENGLPLIGKVAAGTHPGQEHIESHYQVDPPCSTRGQTSCCGCRA
jgi:SOS-response transcriptional repressor LexA